MTVIGHSVYPSLLYFGCNAFLGYDTSLFEIVLISFAGNIPDLDYFYHLLRKKDPNKIINFKHHDWITHVPMVYLPFLVLAIIFKSKNLYLISGGIFFHFILDSFFSGDGIRWLYPFSDKAYSFLDKKTKGLHTIKEWLPVFSRLPIFYINVILAVVYLFLFIKLLNFT